MTTTHHRSAPDSPTPHSPIHSDSDGASRAVATRSDTARAANYPAHITRKGVLQATALVAIGSICIQLSSFAASKTFTDLGTPAASSGRMLFAALILLVLFRPKVRGLAKSDWLGVVVYGGSMALMNLSLFAAVERLPLGIAVTIEFLGPCVVALIASRKLWEGVCAVLALGGVILIAGPSGDANLVGVLFALGAAVSFALYTVSAEKVGKSEGGMGNLALSVSFAALILLPFGVQKLSFVTSEHVLWLLLSAVFGAVIGYGMDTVAAKITSGRVIGTLFAMDPVNGLLIGWIVMGQAVSGFSVGGIVLVALSGALLVWISGGRAAAPEILSGANKIS